MIRVAARTMDRTLGGRLGAVVLLATWVGLLGTVSAPPAQAFEFFDGRLQAHGFFESQFRALNEDYGEDWDVSQWYQVFNLEVEADLVNDTVGPLDLISAYVRAEVRFDCIYSRGCGMFRSMNAYGDRSRSLPRRLSNAENVTASGELFIRNNGRLSGSNTDPVPLKRVNGFQGLAGTEGQFLDEDEGDLLACEARSNFDPDCARGIKPFEYTFDRYLDFRFTQINNQGGDGSGLPVQVLGPWLPKNFIQFNGGLADRVNPFDNSRLNPVLATVPMPGDGGAPDDPPNEFRLPGNGARPFRPIPIFAEDASVLGTVKDRVVAFNDPGFSDPTKVSERRKVYNHGDNRFVDPGGDRIEPFLKIRNDNGDFVTAYDSRILEYDVADRAAVADILRVPISSDRVEVGEGLDPNEPVFTAFGQSAEKRSQARGLFVPSPPLRRAIDSGKFDGGTPFNFREAEREWNRGASQQDEKELKEAYLDIEMFDSQLWMRIGKQQIVWGKTELFRTTDQFNPQDLGLATLASLEETRIGLWAFRGIWSFYEVGPFEDVRAEIAFNFDDYESNDLGACGEPYTVNVVCGATFGIFAHSFTGVGIAGIDKPDDPWESTKGWEVGARLEWRWDRFSFALSNFYGYSDLPAIDRISTYQRGSDPQTGRGLIYDGRRPGKKRETFGQQYVVDRTVGIANDDPWRDTEELLGETGDLVGTDYTAGATVRDPDQFFVNDLGSSNTVSVRSGCGVARLDRARLRYNNGGDPYQGLVFNREGLLLTGDKCLTAGPTEIWDNPRTRRPNDRDLAVPDSDIYARNSLGQPTNALEAHPANLTLFTWLCSTSVGFLDLDRAACAQTVFGSSEPVTGEITVGGAIGRLLAGDPFINAQIIVDNDGPGSAFMPYPLPVAVLSGDPGDLVSLGCTDYEDRTEPCGGSVVPIRFLGAVLSPEQEALLGCGPFWGTSCDQSGIDILNSDLSSLLQSFAGSSGTLTALDLKAQGISYEGTQIIDPLTGEPAPFRAPNEYRTDEGLQPGTLPWEASGIGGPTCTTADLGGNFAPRGQDQIEVKTSPGQLVTKPGDRKTVLPGCHRKWVDRFNGTLNPAWGEPVRASDGSPLRDGAGNVVVDYFYQSGNPDAAGVRNEPNIADYLFPDSVFHFQWQGPSVANPNRPPRGPGHPFASRRGIGQAEELIVPFASEMSALSWNFQMVAVAFSDEFQQGLDAVGDLADCQSPGSNPATCLAPGGSPDGSRGADRRLIAQLLLGYCGTDYGAAVDGNGDGDYLDPEDTPGTCNIEQFFNENDPSQSAFARGIPELRREYLREGINWLPGQDSAEKQNFFDQLQYLNTRLVDSDDTNVPNEPVVGQRATIESQHCSFITPQYCSLQQNIFFLAGLQRNTVKAAGNGAYGRRTAQWHGGGEVGLYFPKRNVLGFALDFAEDRTKSNFSIEATWIEGVPVTDNDSWNNIAETDEFNFTVSMDRPTFINFINPNRTVFINTQWFFQYRQGYERGFVNNGPWNMLVTLTAFTGYFQDRLLPSITYVQDVQSSSGGLLPSLGYRFTENFSVTIGGLWFWGREQMVDIPRNGIAPASNQQGQWAYKTGAQNGISVVRDRDEVFLRLRYTF